MKLAVLFPGIGYTQDKPLLYIAGRLFKERGYEIINIGYHDLPKMVIGDPRVGRQVADVAYACACEQLSAVDFGAYEDIVFAGKSMGTIISDVYVTNNKLPARQIWYTPVEATFQFKMNKDAIGFLGDNDPWSVFADVCKLAKRDGIKLYTYPGRDHSLETGNMVGDIDTLKDVAVKTADFIDRK